MGLKPVIGGTGFYNSGGGGGPVSEVEFINGTRLLEDGNGKLRIENTPDTEPSHLVLGPSLGRVDLQADTDSLSVFLDGTTTGATLLAGVVRAETEVQVNFVKVLGVQQAAIIDPTGGATEDDVARGTIVEILTALRTHGLIAT